MVNCLFCQIIAGKLPTTKVYETDQVLVIKDIHPQAPIHLLVMPKVHVDEFIAADRGLIDKLTQAVKDVIHKEKISGYRLVANGKGAAFVDHLHIHVMGGVAKDRVLSISAR